MLRLSEKLILDNGGTCTNRDEHYRIRLQRPRMLERLP